MINSNHARELEDHVRTAHRPACPQFRFVSAKWIYPVEGYCVLAATPGRLMVPSIKEHREFCAVGRFAMCPWFQMPLHNPPHPRRSAQVLTHLEGSVFVAPRSEDTWVV